MKIQILIIKIIFSFLYPLVKLSKIKAKSVAYISLESVELEGDQKLIYEALANKGYEQRIVSMKFDKKTLWTMFLYFINMIRQLYVVNTSALVILNYNNYVVANYKREGVKVIQCWHASGAIKKFGNGIDREYAIKNYDYVIANSEYWQEPYAQAFDVEAKQVIVSGMASLDCLTSKSYLDDLKAQMLAKYPQLKDKKVVLYAPTFRGNIYTSFSKVDIDLNKVMESLGEDYYLIYKLHPLMIKEGFNDNQRVINGNYEELHALFSIADCLISDYSSIVFEYSMLDKPIYYYAPDYEAYKEKIGFYVDYLTLSKNCLAKDETSLIELIIKDIPLDKQIYQKYMKYHDGANLDRIVKFIEGILD